MHSSAAENSAQVQSWLGAYNFHKCGPPPEAPAVIRLSIDVRDRCEEGMKCHCFIFSSVCEVNSLLMQWTVLLLLKYKHFKKPSIKTCLSSAPAELWPCEFFVYSISVFLLRSLNFLPKTVQFFFSFMFQKEVLVQPSWTFASLAWIFTHVFALPFSKVSF